MPGACSGSTISTPPASLVSPRNSEKYLQCSQQSGAAKATTRNLGMPGYMNTVLSGVHCHRMPKQAPACYSAWPAG